MTQSPLRRRVFPEINFLKASEIYVIENVLCSLYGIQIKDESEIDVFARRCNCEVAALRNLIEGYF